MSPADAARYHAAAKGIEADLTEAYYTTRDKYGSDVAGVLLVFALRHQFNDRPDTWPPPDDLADKVNGALRRAGILRGE